MSDKELVTIDPVQFNKLETDLITISNAGWGVKEELNLLRHAVTDGDVEVTKWLAILNDTLSAGLAEVAKAIREQQPPPPPAHMRGTIMASYSIPDDQPDGTFTLAITATDSEGVPITDPDVLAGLTVELVDSDDSVFQATLGADGRSGTYHVGAPGQATVTQNLKTADGTLIGTGTDGFVVTTGKVALGSVTATFDGLTPTV